MEIGDCNGIQRDYGPRRDMVFRFFRKIQADAQAAKESLTAPDIKKPHRARLEPWRGGVTTRMPE